MDSWVSGLSNEESVESSVVGVCLVNEFLLSLTAMICTSVFSVFSATEKWTSEGRVGDKFPLQSYE